MTHGQDAIPSRVARAIAYAAVVALLGACATEDRPALTDLESDETPPPAVDIVLVPRTPHLATFPCGAQCHDDREPNPAPRELSLFHAGRRLEHGPALVWCDRCHAIDEPDRLTLMDGTRISFDDSDQICGQCHGEKHRDWSKGIHGLQTGGWTGVAHRRVCTACHDPHTPGPIHLESLPAPVPDPRHWKAQ